MDDTSLFRQLERELARNGIPRRTEESRKWFVERVRDLRNINRRELLKDSSLKIKSNDRPLVGRMYMYFYDPKYKETLPYYDRFPLILTVGPAEGGFYGLNLHYLPPTTRAILLDKLMSVATNKRYNDNTRLKLSYELLSKTKNFREFKPCFKHYLIKHIDSRVVEVHPADWEAAIFLPTEQFKKKNRFQVWNESKRIYRS